MGVEGLRPKALDQLFVASELLLASLILTVVVMIAGRTAIIKHPAEPFGEHSASIWRTPPL